MLNRRGEATTGIVAIVFFALLLLAMVFVGIPVQTAITVVVGCVVFFISFINIDVALIILIFSMLLSPEFTSGDTSGRAVKIRADDIFLMIIFCGWIAKMAINKEMGLLKQTRLNAPIIIYTLICVFASFLGVVAGRTNAKSAFFFLFKYIEYFLLFFMVVNNLKTVKQAKRFVFFLLLTCFLVCIYAHGQVSAGGRASAPFESGAGGEPNTFAGYLTLMMSVMIAFIIYPDSARHRIVLFVLLGTAAVAFLMTLSRSGWLSFFPAAATFIVMTKKYRFQMVVLAVLVALALPIVAPEKVRFRVQETFTPWKEYNVGARKIGVDESTFHRINSWKVGINRWSYKPIFGYGIPAGAVIDNQYTRVLNETGVVGFAVFLWMLFTIFDITRKRYLSAGEDKFALGISLGLMAGFMGLLLLSSAASAFILIRIMEPFWFIVAIVTMLPELESAQAKPPEEAAAAS